MQIYFKYRLRYVENLMGAKPTYFLKKSNSFFMNEDEIIIITQDHLLLQMWYDQLAVHQYTREGQRFFTMEFGEQCVMICGTAITQLLCVHLLDSRRKALFLYLYIAYYRWKTANSNKHFFRYFFRSLPSVHV